MFRSVEPINTSRIVKTKYIDMKHGANIPFEMTLFKKYTLTKRVDALKNNTRQLVKDTIIGYCLIQTSYLDLLKLLVVIILFNFLSRFNFLKLLG